MLCTIWVPNVLRATTACNFSSPIWLDGSAPAALASLLCEPAEPQIIGKTKWLATFLPFRAPWSSFFDFFSSLISLLLPFSSLTLPTSAASSVHIVGSLTSKLPSMISYCSFVETWLQMCVYIYIHIYIYAYDMPICGSLVHGGSSQSSQVWYKNSSCSKSCRSAAVRCNHPFEFRDLKYIQNL